MTPDNSWKKNLYALFISQFFYRAGTRSLIPFLPLFVKELGGSNVESTALWSGWVFAAPFIISFFTTPFWGSVGDRYGRKLTTLLSIFGFIVAQISMSFASSLTFLLIASSTQELFGGAYPAAVSLTAANSPKEKTTEALSYLQFANALGNVAGPVLGGILSDIFGFRVVFIIVATVVFVSSVPVLFFVEELHVTKEPKFFSFGSNIKYFVKKRELFACGVMLLAYTLSLTMMRPNFTIFIQRQFTGLNNLASVAGVLFGLFGAAGVISVAVLPVINKKISEWNILAVAFAISAIGFLLLNFSQSIYSFAVVLFLTGLAVGSVLPLLYSIMSSETGQERKAGVMGIGSSFQMAGNLAGPVIAGYIVSIFGLNFSFAGSGIILATAILFYIIWNKNDKMIGKK